MARRALIHPQMLDRLPQFYPSEATIEEPTETRDSFGSTSSTWATLASHSAIPCRVAPLTVQTPTFSNEAKLEDLSYLTTTHHIALRGYFPLITPLMRAMVDGVAWDIKGVEHDGQHVTTRLRVNRVQL
jgi:hypothetical protein